MPTGIVTETCPAPECNLTEQDVEKFMAEMAEYTELFAPAFQRVEQMGWSRAYLRGLLWDALRKNIEQIALGMGEKCNAKPNARRRCCPSRCCSGRLRGKGPKTLFNNPIKRRKSGILNKKPEYQSRPPNTVLLSQAVSANAYTPPPWNSGAVPKQYPGDGAAQQRTIQSFLLKNKAARWR